MYTSYILSLYGFFEVVHSFLPIFTVFPVPTSQSVCCCSCRCPCRVSNRRCCLCEAGLWQVQIDCHKVKSGSWFVQASHPGVSSSLMTSKACHSSVVCMGHAILLFWLCSPSHNCRESLRYCCTRVDLSPTVVAEKTLYFLSTLFFVLWLRNLKVCGVIFTACC